VISVAISLSVVLLLAIILVVLIRGGSLKAGPAVVAILFGFFLASTGMADDIQRFLNSIAETLNSIQF
jgi:flagellar biosynthesis protein FliQ